MGCTAPSRYKEDGSVHTISALEQTGKKKTRSEGGEAPLAFRGRVRVWLCRHATLGETHEGLGRRHHRCRQTRCALLHSIIQHLH